MRYEHHIDHTFLQATHYQDQGGVLTVDRGEEEVARFPAGSWDGVYRYARNRVREVDGGERTAKGLESSWVRAPARRTDRQREDSSPCPARPGPRPDRCADPRDTVRPL